MSTSTLKTLIVASALAILGLHNLTLRQALGKQRTAELSRAEQVQLNRELRALATFEAEMQAESRRIARLSAEAPVGRSLRPQEARGTQRGSWRRTRDQGCRLARMCVSEDTRPLRRAQGGGTEGRLTADHHGIAEVVVNNKGRLRLKRHGLPGKVRTWAQVMGELSPHVNRVVEPQPGKPRQLWTSSLPCSGDETPEGWTSDPHAGDWEIARMYWPEFRDRVVSLWLADRFDDVPGQPIGWGSMSGDVPRALARGMELVEWGDGRNGFVQWPRNAKTRETAVKLIPAALAASRKSKFVFTPQTEK